MNKNTPQRNEIGILGCGWLGMALGEELVRLGKRVRGSTRQKSRFDALRAKGIVPFKVDCEPTDLIGIKHFLKGLDQLIIALPPGLRQNPKRRFDLVIKNLIPNITKAEIKHVIFISSTAVYGNQQGIISEKTRPKPDSESGKQLLWCENEINSNASTTCQILRLGGLIGPDRHPIYSLSKHLEIKNPAGKINYIHQKDAIGILLSMLESPQETGIFNGVCPHHPQRYLYFKKMAKMANLSCPSMGLGESNIREVSARKVMKTFHYTFIVDNLLTLN